MELQQETQQKLAKLIQQSIEKRLCTLEEYNKNQLNEDLQCKQLEILSLYDQVNKLNQINQQLQERLDYYQKISEEIQYEKNKILSYKRGILKSNTIIINSNNNNNHNNNINSSFTHQRNNSQSTWTNNNPYQFGSSNILNTQTFLKSTKHLDDFSDILQQQAFQQLSIYSNNNYNKLSSNNYIVENLKRKIINIEDDYEKQIQQLQQKIQQLQNRLKQTSHFQELMMIYQEKYQQSLQLNDKLSQYQKEKRKVYQEIAQKDYIISQLKQNIEEINSRLIQIEQQKIDLQLTLSKRNNINNRNKQSKNICIINNNNNKNILHIPQLQRIKSSSQKQNPLDLSHNELFNELEIKYQSQCLQLKRLQRRQKQLLKQNKTLKQKVLKLKILQTQNQKLSNIIIQLHTKKNEEVELLTSIIYQTYKQFEYKFKKLIGNKSQLQPLLNQQNQQNQQYQQMNTNNLKDAKKKSLQRQKQMKRRFTVNNSKINQISNTLTHKRQRSMSKKTSIFKGGKSMQKDFLQNKYEQIKQVQLESQS